MDGDYPIGGPGKTVEADETFIGGRDEGGKPDDKAIVLGIVERGGDVLTRHVLGRSHPDLVPHLARYVKTGSKLYTDDWPGYDALGMRYEHDSVNHSAKEYVRGDVHTNTIEAFWANVKRGINGTYVHVSKKHLQTYLREFEYRHNLRRTPYLMFDCLFGVK